MSLTAFLQSDRNRKAILFTTSLELKANISSSNQQNIFRHTAELSSRFNSPLYPTLRLLRMFV